MCTCKNVGEFDMGGGKGGAVVRPILGGFKLFVCFKSYVIA